MKQMAYSSATVLDPSNLTSRVTKLVSVLRRAQISSLKQLVEAAATESSEANQQTGRKSQDLKLVWLLECLLPWYTKQGQSTLTASWPNILSNLTNAL